MAEVVPQVLVCVAFLPLVADQRVRKIALILRPLTSIRELVEPKFASVRQIFVRYDVNELGLGTNKISWFNFFRLQMRLDFNSFVISGPSTVSLSIAKMLNGVLNAPTGKEVSQKSTCATDSFSVSNSPNIPNLCGTLSGEHGNYYLH